MVLNKILIAIDSKELFQQVKSGLLNDDTQLFWVKSGQEVMKMLKNGAEDSESSLPDLVVCDMQIQNMGGLAICHEMYLEFSAGRIPEIPTLLLLDREADVYLAKEVGASAYLLKPVNALKLQRIVAGLLMPVSQ